MNPFRVALAASALVAAPVLAAPDLSGEHWWSTVTALAADGMEGRLTGTPGYQRAADAVAAAFKSMGLKPAGDAGRYFQTVTFLQQRVDAAASRVLLGSTPMRLGQDLVLGVRTPQRSVTDVPLVFVGYGIHLPEAGYDDFVGLDLRGKIVVVLNGGPDTLSPALKGHARAVAFYQAMRAAGAVGVISIANPRSMDIPWARIALASSQPGMVLADPALREFPGTIFSASVNPAEAEKLFAGSGHSFAELLALADQARPLPRFALTPTLTATVKSTLTTVTAPNVAALLPGRDPALAAQVVVISAHLDHLGVGEPIAGDRVYNGAMDNASGVASVLEIARALTEARERPRRSLLFLAVCGEEKGLLGSRYFAARPTVRPIVADLNMDMFLPITTLVRMTAFGAEESNLGPLAAAAAKAHGVALQPDLQPDRNLFIRSDQYSFIRAGVPALSLKFAFVPGSPEAALEAAWLRTRYHAPSDDAAGPVSKPDAARFNAIMADLATRIADMAATPAWNADSFFRRFAK